MGKIKFYHKILNKERAFVDKECSLFVIYEDNYVVAIKQCRRFSSTKSADEIYNDNSTPRPAPEDLGYSLLFEAEVPRAPWVLTSKPRAPLFPVDMRKPIQPSKKDFTKEKCVRITTPTTLEKLLQTTQGMPPDTRIATNNSWTNGILFYVPAEFDEQGYDRAIQRYNRQVEKFDDAKKKFQEEREEFSKRNQLFLEEEREADKIRELLDLEVSKRIVLLKYGEKDFKKNMKIKVSVPAGRAG